MLEVTSQERRKIALKHLLAFCFHLLGGFKLYRKFAKPAITIVTYHGLVDDDYKGVQPYIFVRQGKLREHFCFYRRNFQVISLEEAIERLCNGQIDKHFLVITFDDGYQDNLTLGLPLLEEFGLSATVFVTTGCIDGGHPLWPDRLRRLVYRAEPGTLFKLLDEEIVLSISLQARIEIVKRLIAYVKTLGIEEREVWLRDLSLVLGVTETGERLMLNSEEIQCLARAGVTIGSHTLSHPILSCIELDTARKEITESCARLESITGQTVKLFAYPNGTVDDFDDTHVKELRRAGYSSAVTTIRGVNRAGVDLFRLRRTGVYSIDGVLELQLKLAVEGILK